MDALLEPIMQSPELPRFLAELNEAWADETRRRERFYEEVREDQKAEFINGEVIVHSPAKLRHVLATDRISRLLGHYVAANDLGLVGSEKLLVSLSRNDYEPDICYFAKDKALGLHLDQYRVPAPDMVVEVLSPNIEATDRGTKMRDYAAHGVIEYWLVDPDSETIEQYALRDGSYVLTGDRSASLLESIAVAGFRMPVGAAFDDAEAVAAICKMVTG